jgi:hypothetical protein
MLGHSIAGAIAVPTAALLVVGAGIGVLLVMMLLRAAIARLAVQGVPSVPAPMTVGGSAGGGLEVLNRHRSFGRHSRKVVSLTVLAGVALTALVPAVASARSRPQAVALCPAAEAPGGVDVCIDRGDGAVYATGETITICVTVSIPMILIFPPPPPPLLRLTNTVNGMAPRVIFEEQLASGQRCLDAEITPPLGDEQILAEVLGPDGRVIAADTVTYRSTAGGQDSASAEFLEALRAAGATVELAGEVSQPFFAVPGRLLRVNGADVQVYVYSDEAAARTAAERILPDGSGLGPPTPTRITWIAAPHFYRSGRLIALYVGDDPAILQLLQQALGPPFAGR